MKPAHVCTLVSLLVATAHPASAWERGNHAGNWKKGQTLRICVDKPPADAAHRQDFAGDLDDAMKEWNDAQKDLGGLKLTKADKEPCDVRIHWKDKHSSWGTTDPAGPPVDVTVESDDGLDDVGLKRTLKHELGHVEGLGDSARSDVMDGSGEGAGSMNDPKKLKGPNDDDKAGKKAMYGTAEKKAKAGLEGKAIYNQQTLAWSYAYTVRGQVGPGLSEPVTEFTVTFASGVKDRDVTVVNLPPGWKSRFYPGHVRAASRGLKPMDSVEAPAPPILSFTAMSPEVGVGPGKSLVFRVESWLPPAPRRAFTNSPHWDSDEAQVPIPSPRGRPQG